MSWVRQIPRVTGYYWYRDVVLAEVVFVNYGDEYGSGPRVMFLGAVEPAKPDDLQGEFWDDPLARPR